MTVVLDASALLAFVQGEPGSEVLEAAGEGLSLADRLCLALAHRLDVHVLTADGAWGSDGRVRQIR